MSYFWDRHGCLREGEGVMSDRERLIKQAEATYVGSSLPWLWDRERRAIAHAVDAVLAALAEPEQKEACQEERNA